MGESYIKLGGIKYRFVYDNRMCNVTLDPNGGTFTEAQISSATANGWTYANQMLSKKVSVSSSMEFMSGIEASLNGFNFSGWYDAMGDGVKVGEPGRTEITEDITFYAHWTSAIASMVVTTFNVNGGKNITWGDESRGTIWRF